MTLMSLERTATECQWVKFRTGLRPAKDTAEKRQQEGIIVRQKYIITNIPKHMDTIEGR